MVFTTLTFLVFFVVVVLAYYAIPHRFRYIFLFLASCYFYMAFVPEYILILLFLIVIDFFFAKEVERSEGRRRKAFFIGSLIANVGVLFTFKYFNFFNENAYALAEMLGWNYSIESLQLILPIGLSFHIFQSLSYVIEVYRGKYPAEKNIGMYGAYVMFFPQLVAGPIERPQNLLTQLKQKVVVDYEQIFYGLRVMAWGFFKKLVIADRLAISVDHVYANIDTVEPASVFFVTILFAFQLYADFSGYSDIARGTARVLGIDVMRNFDRPYGSKSIAEFWRRWHISLSTWFRDYFYYPLVYSAVRASKNWLYASVILTFLATGLWHGAGWTFAVMGLIHGTAIAMGTGFKAIRGKMVKVVRLDTIPRVHRALQVAFTFALVSYSWVYFRSPDLSTAFAYTAKLFSGWGMSWSTFVQSYWVQPYAELGITQHELMISIGGILMLLGIEFVQGKIPLGKVLHQQPVLVRSFAYATLVLLIMTLGVYGTNQFIYFQF